MSGDVTNQEIHLNEFSEGIYFRITTFQPATRLLSGEEGLESGQHRQLYLYLTADVQAHGQDMVKGVIVTGVDGVGNHITSAIPRILRVRDQFGVATVGGVYDLGSITQMTQGSMQTR